MTILASALLFTATPPLLPDFYERRGDAVYEYCGSGHVAPPPLTAGASSCTGSSTWMYGYAADSGALIDLMVYYTPAARDAAGGVPQIESLITTAKNIANTSLTNSGLSQQFRVVRMALVNYAETGNAAIDMPRLVEPADGWIDFVHAERDQYGADLVCMVVEPFNFGGVAYQPFAFWPEDDGRYGFSIVRRDNLSFETLAHELGHNFGCQHDYPNRANDGIFPYSYGYREPGNVWKTVMAYPPGQTILNYSNPNVNYGGPLGNPGPTGVPGSDPNVSCNNALTIAQLAFTVANFRPSTLPGVPPARLYVKSGAPGGGDGSSWAAAYTDLQDAISTAVQSRGAVTEIWVRAGTYEPDKGTGDRLRNFRPVNGVSIYGGFVGNETLLSQRDPNLNVTILSGDIGVNGNTTDNSYHVVSAVDLDATAVLDGFTIQHGNANGTGYPHDAGGGVRLGCGSATIRNCRFTLNNAVYGGAASTDTGCTALLDNCRFVSNTATYTGGAIHCYSSALTLTNCQFTTNSAPNNGAMEIVFSGATTLTGCTFTQNSASWSGALGFWQASGCSLLGCTFTSNSAVNGGGAITAGAGSQPTLQGCQFYSNTAGFGGGVYCYDASNAAFVQCYLTGNTASDGAGVYLYNSSPTLTDCVIQNNIAGSNGSGVGGGLQFVAGSAPLLDGCAIILNQAGCCGGALASFDSDPVFTDCEIRTNAANYGGGLWFASGSGGLVERCRLLDNRAGVSGGGAHTTDGSTPIYVSCAFTGNKAIGFSGGAFRNTTGAAAQLINCTLAGNTAETVAGGVEDDGAGTILANTILWGNTDSSGTTQAAQVSKFNAATTTLDFCIVQGWTGSLGGSANNGVNPLFVDADGPDNVFGDADDNVRLLPASGAIDSGDNNRVPVGQTLDLDESPRFRNYPAAPNTGSGTSPFVDRGAYEFTPNCPPDLNADGVVNQADLAALLSCYNLAGNDCGDANGDGQTTQADLALLLSVYNTNCP